MKKLFMYTWWVAIVLAAGTACKLNTGASGSTFPDGSGGATASGAGAGGAASAGAASCDTPADHCLRPDDVLVSEPFASNYVAAHVGKQTAPPNSAGEATYMILADGSTKTSRVAYRSHRAAPAEIAVGALVAVHDATENNVYRAPANRQEATSNSWFVARIVSVDPVPQGHVIVSGGYTVALDALRIIDGDTGPRINAPGAEDAAFIKPDHWIVSTDPLPSQSYIGARLALAIQPPSPATRNEGEFLITGTGEVVWHKHAWRSRPAAPADVKLGAHVLVFDSTTDNVYRAPTSRTEAITGSWFIAKVTDTSEAFKGVVTVAGSYRAEVNGLRVLVK
ncbi:MAG TPA: hypothetical protein VM513_32430 [Kofleriaceae bacterium]|nr:hypothetical protein [Kofleriaceae bacterium]